MFYNPLRLLPRPGGDVPEVNGPFTDRQGRTTEDVRAWWHAFQTTYQFLADDQTGAFSVTTLWLGLPGRVFGTFVHAGPNWVEGREVEVTFSATEAEARAAHQRQLAKYATVPLASAPPDDRWGR
jgi:hypothetical protein